MLCDAERMQVSMDDGQRRKAAWTQEGGWGIKLERGYGSEMRLNLYRERNLQSGRKAQRLSSSLVTLLILQQEAPQIITWAWTKIKNVHLLECKLSECILLLVCDCTENIVVKLLTNIILMQWNWIRCDWDLKPNKSCSFGTKLNWEMSAPSWTSRL